MEKYNHQFFNTIFIDIETISEKASYQDLSPSKKSLWKYKSKNIAKRALLNFDSELAESMYKNKAGIFAEFGKIVCISVGMFYRIKGKIEFQKKSFYSHNEKELLENFIKLITKSFNNPAKYNFCGHNIREFDIPYICRRALINNLKLPSILNISGKKAWQIDHLIDTLQLWKFGDYKHYTSLSLLCDIFNIPSPKDDIDGSMVGEIYWDSGKIDRIAEYCENDVKAVAYLFAKMIGRKDVELIPELNIVNNNSLISKAS